ncbi:hypothetical protein Agub_g7825, partial [Astrephomene gubernaculifera]
MAHASTDISVRNTLPCCLTRPSGRQPRVQLHGRHQTTLNTTCRPCTTLQASRKVNGAQPSIPSLGALSLQVPAINICFSPRIASQSPRLQIVSRASIVALRYGRGGPGANRPQPWQLVSGVCAVALLLCNFHRSVFTALLPLLTEGLGLAPAEV